MAQYYTVVYGILDDFEEHVSALLAEGWLLVGGPFCSGPYIGQALYRLPEITMEVPNVES